MLVDAFAVEGVGHAGAFDLAEVQLALERAVADVTQLDGFELKKVLRTGTVASTDNRNWEQLPHPGPVSARVPLQPKPGGRAGH